MLELMVVVAVSLIVGAGFGAASYRSWLKSDPEKLEILAKQLKAAGEAAKEQALAARKKIDELHK